MRWQHCGGSSPFLGTSDENPAFYFVLSELLASQRSL
jgi:hypothetical protein